jgi:hypothetical protein
MVKKRIEIEKREEHDELSEEGREEGRKGHYQVVIFLNVAQNGGSMQSRIP